MAKRFLARREHRIQLDELITAETQRSLTRDTQGFTGEVIVSTGKHLASRSTSRISTREGSLSAAAGQTVDGLTEVFPVFDKALPPPPDHPKAVPIDWLAIRHLSSR
jgi:hypothetical protein